MRRRKSQCMSMHWQGNALTRSGGIWYTCRMSEVCEIENQDSVNFVEFLNLMERLLAMNFGGMATLGKTSSDWAWSVLEEFDLNRTCFPRVSPLRIDPSRQPSRHYRKSFRRQAGVSSSRGPGGERRRGLCVVSCSGFLSLCVCAQTTAGYGREIMRSECNVPSTGPLKGARWNYLTLCMQRSANCKHYDDYDATTAQIMSTLFLLLGSFKHRTSSPAQGLMS